MQRITPDPAAIGCSAAELRPPRVMRSFETSAHVRSHCSPRLYPSNALRDFLVCVTERGAHVVVAPILPAQRW